MLWNIYDDIFLQNTEWWLNTEKMCNVIVMFPWIACLICFIGNGQGEIILSVKSRSNTKACILDGEVSAIVSCEITPNTSTPVLWKKNTDSLSTCDNTADNCLPAVKGRYSFTSNFTLSQFYLNIPSVALGSDEGVYLCEEGGLDESITLAVCKVPTTVMFTESGSGTVTLTSTSSCVYPETVVTIAWFYVLVSAPNTEKMLTVTPTNGSIRSDCQNDAKKVTSTIQHTDATENMIEVYFRVKVSHPASAEPVEATFNKSYFIRDDNTKQSGNNGAVIGGTIGGVIAGVLVILGIVVYFQLCKDNMNSMRAPGIPASITFLRRENGYLLLLDFPRYQGYSSIEKFHIWKKLKSENTSWEEVLCVSVKDCQSTITIDDDGHRFDYKCYAENQHVSGQPLDTVRKAVMGSLGRPKKVSLNIGDNKNIITWGLPDDSKELEKFYIAISEIDDRQLEKMEQEYCLRTKTEATYNTSTVEEYIQKNTKDPPVIEIFVAASETICKTPKLISDKIYICSICAVYQYGCSTSIYFSMTDTTKCIQEQMIRKKQNKLTLSHH